MGEKVFNLDSAQVLRSFTRAAGTYAQAAVVPREVGRRMAERLEYIRHQPAHVLDAGAGTGEDLTLLRQRYPRAELIGLDIAQAMLRQARRAGSLVDRVLSRIIGRQARLVCGDFLSLPLKSASIGMVWSNLALAWTAEPLAALREFHRVLSSGGLVMFSTYGPDTLKELKAAFGGEGPRHVHSFIDMHDLGDMLVASGFEAPVMDMEKITLTYSGVEALARDLKASGQTCAASDRPRGLTGPGGWRRMLAAYERDRGNGRFPATIEVVYGHAWKGRPRVAADGKQVVQFDFKSRKGR